MPDTVDLNVWSFLGLKMDVAFLEPLDTMLPYFFS